eukprot:3343958-Pleurochrysis_carterae.AAC.8
MPIGDASDKSRGVFAHSACAHVTSTRSVYVHTHMRTLCQPNVASSLMPLSSLLHLKLCLRSLCGQLWRPWRARARKGAQAQLYADQFVPLSQQVTPHGLPFASLKVEQRSMYGLAREDGDLIVHTGQETAAVADDSLIDGLMLLFL